MPAAAAGSAAASDANDAAVILHALVRLSCRS